MPTMTIGGIFNTDRYKAWRRPLDSSYRGLRTKLRSVVSRNYKIELDDTGCTVVLAVNISERLKVWVTSPTAWEQVGDNTSWTVELWDVWYGQRLTNVSRKQRDDEWITSAVQKAFEKGLVLQQKIDKTR